MLGMVWPFILINGDYLSGANSNYNVMLGCGMLARIGHEFQCELKGGFIGTVINEAMPTSVRTDTTDAPICLPTLLFV